MGQTPDGKRTSIVVNGRDSAPQITLASTIIGKPIPDFSSTVEKPQSVSISFPVRGEYFGNRALVRGTVLPDKGSHLASLSLGGRPIPHLDGMFEVILDNPAGSDSVSPWQTDLIATYDDGHKVSRSVVFFRQQNPSVLSEPETTLVSLRAGRAAEAFGADFTLPAGSSPATYTIRCNRYLETPGLPRDLFYSLRSRCASLTVTAPDEGHTVIVTLPSSFERLPQQFDKQAGRIFGFELASSSWNLQADSFVDLKNDKTVGTLNSRSSTIVSGILAKKPVDEGTPESFDKQVPKKWSNVDPRSGDRDIPLPTASSTGAASFDFPMDMRPARGQNKPDVQLSYNSLGSDGSAGEGWSLHIPTISVETKWGVPAFDATKETETYLLDGKELIAYDKGDKEFVPAYRNNFRASESPTDRQAVAYYRLRREETFVTVVKHGDINSLDAFFFEVIYKDGRHEFYGGKPNVVNGSLQAVDIDKNAIQRAGGNKAASVAWGLSYVLDKDENAVRYDWRAEEGCEAAPSGCTSAMRVRDIIYNLHGDEKLLAKGVDDDGYWAPTRISFEWSPRNDRSVTGRTGQLVQSKDRLSRIVTTYGGSDGKVRCYSELALKYTEPSASSLGKSLLASISTRMTDADAGSGCAIPVDDEKNKVAGTAAASKTTSFDYFGYSDASSATSKLDMSFKSPGNVEVPDIASLGLGFPSGLIGKALISASALGTTSSQEVGASTYIGISAIPDKKLSGGLKVGYTNRDSKGETSLVDLTGDGIPDIVYSKGGRLFTCAGKRFPRNGFEACHMADGVQDGVLLREKADNLALGGEFHPWSYLVVGGGYTKSNTQRSSYFADVDGDGLIDLVQNGQVLFNSGTRNAEGGVIFKPTSNNIFLAAGVPADIGAHDAMRDLYAAQHNEAVKKQATFSAVDIVHAWRAPHTGTVVLDAVTLKPLAAAANMLVIERSRGNSVLTCFQSAPITDAAGAITWISTGACGPAKLPNKDAQDHALAAALVVGNGHLPIDVSKGDVIYLRHQSDDKGHFTAASLLATIAYVTLDDGLPDTSAQWNFVKSVFSANGWDRARLASCRIPEDRADDPSRLDPRCDINGKNPYWFDLGSSEVLAGTPRSDPKFKHYGEAGLSGGLRFPATSQPVRLTVLTNSTPEPANSPTPAQQIVANRAFIEPADVVKTLPGWIQSLNVVLSVDCSDLQNPVPLIQGQPVRFACEQSGGVTYATAAFDPAVANFQVCDATACKDGPDKWPATKVRIELQAINDLKASNSILPTGGLSPIDWTNWTWSLPPAIVFTPLTAAKDSLGCFGGTPCTSGNAAWVDGEPRVNNPSPPQHVTVTPIYRDLYQRTIAPSEVRQQSASIDSEENYLGRHETSKRKYPYPVINDQGYRLPGDAQSCAETTADGRKLCRYRVAHSFTALGDILDSTSADAFTFRSSFYIDGRTVLLREVPKATKPGRCDTDFGDNPVYFNRVADCVISFVLNPQPSTADPVTAIDFSLTDGNLTKGRDRVFEFEAEPGSFLHVITSVRPVFNAALGNYTSPGQKPVQPGDPKCTNYPRDINTLLSIRFDRCTPWGRINGSSFRMGIENGLGLKGSYPPLGCGVDGKSACTREDVAEVFVPLSFSDDTECFGGKVSGNCVAPNLVTMSLTATRVATGNQGWSSFAYKNRTFKAVKVQDAPFEKWDEQPDVLRAMVPFSAVQYPANENGLGSPQDVENKANDISGACKSDNGCESKTDSGFAGATSKIAIFPLQPEFVRADSVLGASHTCETAGETVDAARGNIYRQCLKGPDRDIWVELAAGSVAVGSGRLGPDNLIDRAPKAEDADPQPVAGQVALSVPSLISNTNSISFSAGLLSGTQSTSRTSSSFLDMNGDGYPDPIIGGTGYLSGPSGIRRGQWLANASATITNAQQGSRAQQVSVDATIPPGQTFTALRNIVADGLGNLGHVVDGSPMPGATTTPDGIYGLSVGLNANLGQAWAATDLTDVNGDGLPDKVQLDKGSGKLTVAYNLGDRFSDPVDLPVGKEPVSENRSGGLAISVGYNDGNNGWSGGLGLSRSASSSTTTLIDINGDGLPDIVEPSDRTIKVYFNNGNGFESSPLELSIDWSFRDTGASETTLGDVGLSTSPSGPPLCLFSCFLVINPAAKLTRSVGRNLVTLSDLDGDGLPDFVSTKGFYQGWNGSLPQFGLPGDGDVSQVSPYFNPMGKANKLHRIRQTAGSQIALDYKLFGNENADNPRGIWAVSSIATDDGLHPADSEVPDGQDGLLMSIEYAGGRYDRLERRFLGFAEQKTTIAGCDIDSSVGQPTCKDIRVVDRSFDTSSVYKEQLLLKETVSAPSDAGSNQPSPIYRTTTYNYDLVAVPSKGAMPNSVVDDRGCLTDLKACVTMIDKADKAGTAKVLDVWNMTETRRYYPRLSLVTIENRERDSSDSLISALLYNYDADGNVIVATDLGQLNEASDEYRVDLSYDKSIIPSVKGTTVSNLTASPLLDTVAELRISAGTAKEDKEPRNVLRLRRAAYDGRGHLQEQCEFRVVSRALLSKDPLSSCRDLGAVSRDKTRINSIMNALSLEWQDVSIATQDFDEFGNLIRTRSPLNEDGEWIERNFAYAGFSALSPTDINEQHCRLANGTSDCAPFASFNSQSVTDRRFALPIETTDINGQKIYQAYDEWGRRTTIVASWAPLNYQENNVSQEAKNDCSILLTETLPKSEQKRPEETCKILLHASYDDSAPAYSGHDLRVATIDRYVNAALYNGGVDTGDPKSVVHSAIVVDPTGKAVQTIEEAAACTAATDAKTLDDLKGVALRARDLCQSEERYVASGWIAYDGLGRKTSEYYPRPLNIAAMELRAAARQLPSRNDLTSATAADYMYDPIDRPSKISLPGEGSDGQKNTLSFAYSVVTTDRFARLRTIARDARCAVKAYDRDARGRIRSVGEINSEVFEKASATSAKNAQGRAFEVHDCKDADDTVIASKLAVPADGVDSITTYRYDALDELTAVIRPVSGRAITIAYDMLGQRGQLNDPDRAKRSTTYDPLGNVVLETFSPYDNADDNGGNKLIRYRYEANRLQRIDYGEGNHQYDVQFAYDKYPAQDWTGWTASPQFFADYQQMFSKGCAGCNGKLVAVQDQSGVTISDFDSLGQTRDTWRSVVDAGSEIGRFHLSNRYDSWGVLQQSRIDDLAPVKPADNCLGQAPGKQYLCGFSATQTFVYDQAARLHQVSLDGQAMGLFAYNEFGQVVSEWSSDGSVTTNTYDAQDRRLNGSDVRLLGNGSLSASAFQYDAGGNVLSYKITGDKYLDAQEFEYDAASRLIHANSGKDSIIPFEEDVSYDALHRIATKGDKTYRYSDDGTGNDGTKWRPLNAPDRISTKMGDQDRTYTRFGNLNGVTAFDENGQVLLSQKLQWDPENRLASVEAFDSGESKRETYVYDYLGKRTIKHENDGSTTLYIIPDFSRRYGGPAHIHVVGADGRLASRAIAVPASGDQNETYFYHDVLPNGSVNTVTRQVPDLAFQSELYQRIVYSPYGDMLYSCTVRTAGGTCTDDTAEANANVAASGNAPISQDRDQAPLYAYSGKERDKTGFAYFGARYYASEAGQWLSPDPMQVSYLAGTPNKGVFSALTLASYSYANENPISNGDKDGRYVTLVTAAGGAVIGAAFGAAVGWATGGDIGHAALRGAIVGGVSGLTLGIGGATVAGWFGTELALGGAAAGSASSTIGEFAGQSFDIATGTEQSYNLKFLLYAAGAGAVFGALELRPATPRGAKMTNWRDVDKPFDLNSGRWVQMGRDNWFNRLSGTGLRGEKVATSILSDQVELTYPRTGWREEWKGLLGQRQVK
jgi:RHS repeat-associated protein